MSGEQRVGGNEIASSAIAWVVLLATLFVLVVGAALSAASLPPPAASAGTGAGALVAATSVPPVTTTTVVPAGACRVTIRRGQASLHVQPSSGSRRLLNIPDGDYTVAASQALTHGTDQRWLLIDVGGINGWVRDMTANIEGKSADCV